MSPREAHSLRDLLCYDGELTTKFIADSSCLIANAANLSPQMCDVEFLIAEQDSALSSRTSQSTIPSRLKRNAGCRYLRVVRSRECGGMLFVEVKPTDVR